METERDVATMEFMFDFINSLEARHVDSFDYPYHLRRRWPLLTISESRKVAAAWYRRRHPIPAVVVW